MRLFLVLLPFLFSSCSSKIVTIHSAEEYHKILTSSPKVLVFLTASWCPPCRSSRNELKSEVEQHEKYPDVEFLIVDIEENEDVAKGFNTEQLPTSVAFKGGKVTAKHVGMLTYYELTELMKKIE